MDIKNDMEFGQDADPSGRGGPPECGPPGPPGGGPLGGPPGRAALAGPPYRGSLDRGPPGGSSGEDPPDEPQVADIPENIWRWIVYLKRKIGNLEPEAQINKIEIGKSATIAAKAPKKLDNSELEGVKLGGLVTKLQRKLDRLEDLRSDGSDLLPPLESGSDDS